MEELSIFFNNLTIFPTNIMTVIFVVLFCLLLVSFISSLDQDFGIDFDLDGDADMSLLGKIFIASGLSKTPLVIGLSITGFIGLIISYTIQFNLLPFLFEFNGFIRYLIGIPFFFIIFTVSLYIAGFICKPLEGLFDIESTRAKVNYIGKNGTVKTLEVTDDFGEVEIITPEHDYLIDVYGSEILKKGDSVVIVSFNEEKNRYLVKKI